MEEENEKELNWSEEVEDLVAAGNSDAAIIFLESVISKLDMTSDPDPRLGSALSDLANLYSSIGFSLKADGIQAKALLIKQRLLLQSSHFCSSCDAKTMQEDQSRENDSIHCGSSSYGSSEHLKIVLPVEGTSDDDWEAIADRSPKELLSPQSIPGVSQLSPLETKVQSIKRRGRGTFSYNKKELYSHQLSDKTSITETEVEDVSDKLERNLDLRSSKYGTRHVLVLADFPPSTKTTELEKLLEDFKDGGFVIRWINDTLALAVFRTPSTALEASKCIRCPFKVRILEANDILLSSIAPNDLEPPRERPKTSARTARRLIAQGMGLKLPSTGFGSRELRKQEDERRNRIVTRQKLKDDAWGAE